MLSPKDGNELYNTDVGRVSNALRLPINKTCISISKGDVIEMSNVAVAAEAVSKIPNWLNDSSAFALAYGQVSWMFYILRYV